MKSISIFITIFLFSIGTSFSQKKNNEPATMVDKYFTTYSNLPNYKVNTMGEAMIRRSNETGMWTHPGIARIMKQVKFTKYLKFDSSAELNEKILDQLGPKIKKDHIYDEYFKWELNGTVSSVIYTKGKKAVTEVVYITLSSNSFIVGCYVGDNIDMESIRKLALNN